jgi:ribonucleoside-diphosphate reductase alpha chain
MSGRLRLPNRRASTSFDIEVAGLRYKATISRFPDGRLAELFVSNHKAGNASDAAARDAGILVSLCLQHGCDVATIAQALLVIPMARHPTSSALSSTKSSQGSGDDDSISPAR